jgi:hypothetical protein
VDEKEEVIILRQLSQASFLGKTKEFAPSLGESLTQVPQELEFIWWCFIV